MFWARIIIMVIFGAIIVTKVLNYALDPSNDDGEW